MLEGAPPSLCFALANVTPVPPQLSHDSPGKRQRYVMKLKISKSDQVHGHPSVSQPRTRPPKQCPSNRTFLPPCGVSGWGPSPTAAASLLLAPCVTSRAAHLPEHTSQPGFLSHTLSPAPTPTLLSAAVTQRLKMHTKKSGNSIDPNRGGQLLAPAC